MFPESNDPCVSSVEVEFVRNFSLLKVVESHKNRVQAVLGENDQTLNVNQSVTLNQIEIYTIRNMLLNRGSTLVKVLNSANLRSVQVSRDLL